MEGAKAHWELPNPHPRDSKIKESACTGSEVRRTQAGIPGLLLIRCVTWSEVFTGASVSLSVEATAAHLLLKWKESTFKVLLPYFSGSGGWE